MLHLHGFDFLTPGGALVACRPRSASAAGRPISTRDFPISGISAAREFETGVRFARAARGLYHRSTA
jgi:hypothetical protein